MTAGTVRRVGWRTVVLAVVWGLLAGVSPVAWAIGALLVPLAVWMSLALEPAPGLPGAVAWRAVGRLLRLWIGGIVHGTVDTARALLGRDARYVRGALEERTLAIESEALRMLFAGLMGSMPGTVPVAVEGRSLRYFVLRPSAAEHARLDALEAAVAALERPERPAS